MAETNVVAIDGPLGSGKSTVARRVAARLGYTLLDTGAIYRSLALRAQRLGVAWDDEPAMTRLAEALELTFDPSAAGPTVMLFDDDVTAAIRTPEMAAGASAVSRLAGVRQALLEVQRGFAARGPLVAEGRDMGTVVFPQARVKVFLDGDEQVRARRRYEELLAAGHAITFDEVLQGARARDAADSQRKVAPLRRADDAVLVDTTSLSIDEVVDRIVALCRGR